MAKRTAGKELTHDNWAEDDEKEDMGTFQQASAEQLVGRNIKKAKRRSNVAGPSVFKGLPVFAGFGTTTGTSTQPTFSFLSNISKPGSETAVSPKVENVMDKTSQPLRITQDTYSSNVKGSDSKSNGFMDSKDSLDTNNKSDNLFLCNLKALNEGVLHWIQKHLDKNPHVNLLPVFDDYKKHYSDLLKKFPSDENGKERDDECSASSSKKEAASGKENNPVLPEVSRDSGSVKTFSFGADKSSEANKPTFSFSAATSDAEKKTDAPTFTFTGFNSSGPKSEGLVFGNLSGSSGFLFGMSAQAPKPPGGGFSFGNVTSTTADKKENKNETEENEEPPKVEVNEVKEDGSFYDKKCKLFYMKDGAYVDRGVGTLYLKTASEKTQLLVRAYTNLGNILLNIVLNSSIPTARVGKNGVLLVCIPNPPLEKMEGPVKMLIRVKTSEDADELLSKLNEHKK
ncbi:Nuclear pore complex protein Nup50 [Halocaridina rubra]|uniref:Nuclear pore complex protein Nup50 n=1 Tax=Halocaridina rubra TaxID=373956 RepID=A0AAN8WMQ8_HALRR